MKRIQVATITFVLLLLVQSVAMATSRYSPGPSTVSDGWGTWFSVQHLIDYTWQGSSGPYTNYQSLRIDAMVDRIHRARTDMHRAVARGGPAVYAITGTGISQTWH